MVRTIILVVVLLASLILITLKVYELERSEKEKTKKRLEVRGEIILNVLALLREAYPSVFKDSSLVYGYRLSPWKDKKNGIEILSMGALVSDINQAQVEIMVPSETKRYIVLSSGNKPYQNFTDKTNEDDVSEKGLVDVIQKAWWMLSSTTTAQPLKRRDIRR
ncbi:MAG: hypothetical protein Q8N73_00575 [bacterium]|nr:hypothetical protein [bacterium]